MNAKHLLAAAATLLAASAHAGYDELDKELKSYEPPVLYRSKAEAAPQPPAVISTVAEDEFRAQIEKLRELKAGWEEALKNPVREESFYAPEAGLLKELSGTEEDPKRAEEALRDGFTLETLEALALLRSPGVKAKERELRAALEGYGQVENLDTLLRRYSLFAGSVMTGVGNMESPDSPASKFPFPGILALKGQIVTQDAKAMRAGLEAVKRDAVTDARKAYWELLYTESAVETMGQMLALMDNLRSGVSARYETGEATFLDVVRIGIEKEKIKEELRTMEEDRRNMAAMVREVLNLPPDVKIGSPSPRAPGAEELSEDMLASLAKEKRQELAAMKAMITRMELMLEMSESMVYPGFSFGLANYERGEIARVGADAGMEGGGGAFPATTTASMGEGLPKMAWFGRDEPYLGEIRQRIEALKKELEMEEAGTALSVRRAWFARDKAIRERSLYGERVNTLSQSALEAATSGYSTGKVMFLDLIESFNAWLSANLSAGRSLSDLGVANAELEAAVGVSPLK